MKNRLLNKVLLVLDALAESGALSVNELAERFSIPLPTMSRLLSDMVEMKLVEKIDYYRVAPAPGLIRLGECARKHSALVQKISPALNRFAEKIQMNVLLAGIDKNTMFTIYHHGKTAGDENIIHDTGLALVLLHQTGATPDECREFMIKNHPGISDTDLLILNREMESLNDERQLFRANTMRQWSCAMGFTYRGLDCGFCFYGRAPECSRERFVLDCSMVLSHITAILKDE